MKRENARRILLHGFEALYSLALLAWFLAPLLGSLPGLPVVTRLPAELLPEAEQGIARAVVAALVYLMPAIRLYMLACLFLAPARPGLADPRRSFPILLSLASSALALVAILVPVVRQAASWRYFAGLSPVLVALFILSLAHNAFFLSLLIARLNSKDESYRDYLEFRRAGAGRPGGFLRSLLAQGIQKRLVVSFTALILLVIVVLSLVLMRNFSRTILTAVIENGKELADRTASVIRANFGDDIALDDYFGIEARKNAEAVFRFDELTYYRRGAAGGEFRVAASTAPAWIGESLSEPDFSLERTGYRFEPELRLFEFRAPVLVRNILIGFVQLDYARDVIYEPYFRTQVKVFVIAALFIYASVFLIYVFGRAIVFPILFLRMSVNRYPGRSAGMIRGKRADLGRAAAVQGQGEHARRDQGALRRDRQHDHRDPGRHPLHLRLDAQALRAGDPTAEKRDLTFLFTDIRGFTTLCEGQSPRGGGGDAQPLPRHPVLGDPGQRRGHRQVRRRRDHGHVRGPEQGAERLQGGLEIRTAMAEEKERGARRAATWSPSASASTRAPWSSAASGPRTGWTSPASATRSTSRPAWRAPTRPTAPRRLITRGGRTAKVKEQFLCREIDLLTVKGKRQPVRIYEVLQELKAAGEKLREIKKIFEGGLVRSTAGSCGPTRRRPSPS